MRLEGECGCGAWLTIRVEESQHVQSGRMLHFLSGGCHSMQTLGLTGIRRLSTSLSCCYVIPLRGRAGQSVCVAGLNPCWPGSRTSFQHLARCSEQHIHLWVQLQQPHH